MWLSFDGLVDGRSSNQTISSGAHFGQDTPISGVSAVSSIHRAVKPYFKRLACHAVMLVAEHSAVCYLLDLLSKPNRQAPQSH